MKTPRIPFISIPTIVAFVALVAPSREAHCAPSQIPVFEAGQDGYKVFRIPALIAAANGDLLAFCEARQGGDASEIDLVSKRSTDNGKTWGPLAIVQESDDFKKLYKKGTEITIGNPAPVVDLLDPKHPGRIWLPFTIENDRVFVTSSDDHGATWSEPREITTEVKKPEWGWYATGPVHSIQIQRGPHRGRLVIPTDHRLGDDGADKGANGAHNILSDDHGKTWRLGAIDDTYEDGLNANETTVVELNDGSLYFNTRDQHGKAPGTRGEAWSTDGGESFNPRSKDWKQFRPTSDVLDPPVVQCALLRVDDDLLLFSGPDENGPTGKGRSDLRLRYSTDEAKTWQDGPLLHTGPAAYSDMVLLPKKHIGVLFEAGDPGQKSTYQRIVFTSLAANSVIQPETEEPKNRRTAAKRPNILFILVDDLGWADLGYQGSTFYETPHIDRFATQGMVFSDFYSGGPVCSPTRASILTGKSTARTGITTYLLSPSRDAPHVTNHLPLEEFTLAEALKKNGYATGYIGKWHLGYKAEHWASHQGFDLAKGGLDIPWAWELCYPGTEAPTAKTWRKGHTRFFSPHHLTHLENGPEGEYLTDRLTDETIAFIEEERAEPFFAFLSFHTVHTPLEAKPDVVARYTKKLSKLGLDKKKEKDNREKTLQDLPEYAAMVHHLDENVGRLLDRLDELDLANDTIVVFTSDNGGKGSVTSNLPLRGMKHNLYEGGIRVPTIIRWPGRIEAGPTNATPLISDDFYPTLLELAGCPPEPEQHLDGVSFANLLTGDAPTFDRGALHWHYPHSRQEAAIREGRYKLLHRFNKDTVELYDLETDIGERKDLSTAKPQLTSRLLAQLQSWQTEVGAKFAK